MKKNNYQKPIVKSLYMKVEGALLVGTTENEVTKIDGNSDTSYGGGSDGSPEQGGPARGNAISVWDEEL